MGQLEKLPATPVEVNDLLSIDDVSRVLRGTWRWAAAFAAIGAGVGLAGLMVLPAKYEAVAYVQPGQFGQPGQTAPVPVESPHQAIERMSTGEFQLELANTIGDQDMANAILRSGALKGGPFKASVVKNTGRIELRVRGRTTDAARQLTEAIIAGIAKRHLDLAQPTINRLKHELTVVQEKRKAFEATYEELGKVLASARLSDQRFTQYSLATSVRLSRENDVYALRQQELALQIALSEPTTQPAKAVEPIFVGSEPISPKRPLLLGGGLLFGGLLGFLIGFLRMRKLS